MKTEQENTFHALLEKQYKQIASDSLQKSRDKAWNHFLSLGLPNRQNEVYRGVRLKNLFSQQYEVETTTEIHPEAISPHIYPECRNSVIVFVNGHYTPSLSSLPSKIILSSLRDATKTFGSFLNNQWTQWLKEEADPFAVLNAALHRDGIFLYLPPKCIVETPIQILHVIDSNISPLMLMPRIHIFAGAHSDVTLVTSTISASPFCVNQMTDIAIEENARVRYFQMSYQLPAEAWYFDAVRTQLKRNSHFHAVAITEGSATVRHDYRVNLMGENAETSLNGLFMLSDKREAHVNILIDHQAPHCRSTQLFKTVLNDVSRSFFEGKIFVKQEAQKTEAFQLNNNLLLSERAHADSKPNLEIFADDVKASHGATVGQLDPEHLFYMKARGFSESDAKSVLVHSYTQEIINQISIASLKHSVNQRAAAYLRKT